MYSNKLYISTAISKSSAVPTSALFILFTHLTNSAQFLKTTSLSILSVAIAGTPAPCPTSYSSFNKYICITIIK